MLKLKRGELIKCIEGFEELYQITTLGRIFNIRKNSWMKLSKSKSGYCIVTLSKYGKSYKCKVHRLVGKAFIANTDNKPQINHINGNKGDNQLTNLEWCTALQNIQHACNTGLSKVFKIHTDLKHTICKIYHTGKFSQKKLAEVFSISQPAIWYILKAYTPIVYPV